MREIFGGFSVIYLGTGAFSPAIISLAPSSRTSGLRVGILLSSRMEMRTISPIIFPPVMRLGTRHLFPPSFKLLKQKNRTQVQRRACSAPSPFGALHGKEFWNTCWNLCAGKWFLLENNTIDTGEVDVGRRAMQVIPPGQLKIMWISHFWMWFTMYWDLSSVQNLYYLYLLNLVSLIIRISSLSKVFFGGLSYISTSRSF